MHTIDPQPEQDLPAFREKTAEFYAGTLDKVPIRDFPDFMAAMPEGRKGQHAASGG